MSKTRRKTRAVTVYVDPKYEDKLSYLRYKQGITDFFEECLEKLQIDEKTMKLVKQLQEQMKKD